MAQVAKLALNSEKVIIYIPLVVPLAPLIAKTELVAQVVVPLLNIAPVSGKSGKTSAK